MSASYDELVPRLALPRVQEALTDSRAVCVIGPRQAGKSTLCELVLDAGHPARRYTLDDPATLRSALEDPVEFVAALGPHVMLDEIQRAPDLLLALKMRLDRDRSRGQFLLTGSANILTLPGVRDALPGRVEYVSLWPLAQCEIERTRGGFVEDVLQGRLPDVVGAVVGSPGNVARVVAGGYPDAIGRSERSRWNFFSSYLGSVLQRDVADARASRSSGDVVRLLRAVAPRSGALLNFSDLATRMGIDARTARAYFDVLQDLFLVQVVAPWHSNRTKRALSTPKAYVTDTGLLAYLLEAPAAGLPANSAAWGSLLETFVAMEVTKQVGWLDAHVGVFHYRDRDAREVDLVLERADGAVVAIEVKAGTKPRSSDLRGLRHVRDRLGDEFIQGIVLTTGDQVLPLDDRIHAVPLAALWS